jgi:hypothetical protein
MVYSNIRSILKALTAISEDIGVRTLHSSAEISRKSLKIMLILDCEEHLHIISLEFTPKSATGSLKITSRDTTTDHLATFENFSDIAGMLVSWGVKDDMQDCWSSVTDKHVADFLNLKGQVSYFPSALCYQYMD